MSDHHHEEPNNPVGKIVSGIFLIAVPAALIAMLAVTGFAFVKNMKAPPVEVAERSGEDNDDDDGGGDNGGGGRGGPPKTTAYASCATCHGTDGKGVPAGPMLMAPSLVGSELLLHEDPNVPLLIVLRGIQKQGNETLGVMAPLGGVMSDQQIAEALTYARKSFGNSGSEITTEQAKAARAKFSGLDAPVGVKRDEVLKIVEEHK